jgi:hypothetical protein
VSVFLGVAVIAIFILIIYCCWKRRENNKRPIRNENDKSSVRKSLISKSKNSSGIDQSGFNN